jgi:hypothetical protein
MIEVREGQYPHYENQIWAEPDIDEAVVIADRFLSDATFARAAAVQGMESVRRTCSLRAVGLRMLDRVNSMVVEA